MISLLSSMLHCLLLEVHPSAFHFLKVVNSPTFALKNVSISSSLLDENIIRKRILGWYTQNLKISFHYLLAILLLWILTFIPFQVFCLFLLFSLNIFSCLWNPESSKRFVPKWHYLYFPSGMIVLLKTEDSYVLSVQGTSESCALPILLILLLCFSCDNSW